MELNWGKSTALRLGVWNTPPPPGPIPLLSNRIKIHERYPRGKGFRHLSRNKCTSRKLHHNMNSKIRRVLDSKLRHCGDQIGDTITVNSLFLSIPIYSTRLQYHSHTFLNIDTLALKFVRGNSYLITNEQRHASRKDGAIVPLIKLVKLAITLTAKWFYRILSTPDPNFRPIFSEYWLSYIPHIL
jgi:hypothetical protein